MLAMENCILVHKMAEFIFIYYNNRGNEYIPKYLLYFPYGIDESPEQKLAKQSIRNHFSSISCFVC